MRNKLNGLMVYYYQVHDYQYLNEVQDNDICVAENARQPNQIMSFLC